MAGFAAKRGENRHDLTARRKQALEIKALKLQPDSVFPFYPIKLLNFYEQLKEPHKPYSVPNRKFFIAPVRGSPFYALPNIKNYAFRAYRKFNVAAKKNLFKAFRKRKLFSNKFLLHNKIWQKRLFHKYEKQFFPFLSQILSKLKRNLSKTSHYTGHRQLSAKNSLLFSNLQPSLLVCLKRLFVGFSFNFCMYLLENKQCNVNGVCISDPWFIIPPYSIINFGLLPVHLFLAFVLSSRFIKKNLKTRSLE